MPASSPPSPSSLRSSSSGKDLSHSSASTVRGTATVRRTTPLANGGMDPPPDAPSWPDASCVRPRRPARTRASASATDDAEPRWTCWHVSTGGRAGADASPIAGSEERASSVVGATTCTASAETAGAVVLVAASASRMGERSRRLGAGLALAARRARPSPARPPDAADARGARDARNPAALISARHPARTSIRFPDPRRC